MTPFHKWPGEKPWFGLLVQSIGHTFGIFFPTRSLVCDYIVSRRRSSYSLPSPVLPRLPQPTSRGRVLASTISINLSIPAPTFTNTLVVIGSRTQRFHLTSLNG